MTYEKSLPLTDLVYDGELLTFGAQPVVIGDEVYMFPGWRTSDNLKIPNRSAVVRLDTTNDTVEVVTYEGPCGYTRDGVVGDDGLIYIATEAYGAAVRHLNTDNAAAPCLVRFDPSEGDFDSSYAVDLTTFFDGNVAGSLVVDAKGNSFLLALDPASYAGPPAARPLASSAAWRLAKFVPGDAPSASFVAEHRLLPGSLLLQNLGAESILPLFTGTESSELFAFGKDGVGDSLATTPGLVFSAVKLR
jgi:hypothetical protein